MSFADKKHRSRKTTDQSRPPPHVPMGDHRFQELLGALGAAFAQADDGEEKRKQARARERQHEQWLAQRAMTIEEIVALMQQHGLGIDDLA